MEEVLFNSSTGLTIEYRVTIISLSLDHKIKSIYTVMTRSSKPSDKVDLSDREICLIKRG